MNRLGYIVFLSIICLLSYSTSVVADNIHNPLLSSSNTVTVETDRDGTITIDISVEDFDTIPVIIGADKYYNIILPEGHSPLQRGNPDLPVISKSFIIPDNQDFSIRVIENDYHDYVIPVAPSKGSIRRNQNWEDIQYFFSDIYNDNSFFPREIATTQDTYYLRDVQGCNIQICPFKYNPIERLLRVYNHLKIEISFPDGSYTSNIYTKSVNKHYTPIIKHNFINSDYYLQRIEEKSRNGEQLRSLDELYAKMLVICCDTFATEMRNFIIHKNNLGIPTTLVKMSDVGTTANHLKTYIQNAYNNDNDLTYVLLVGDSQQIPTPKQKYLLDISNYGDSIFGYGAADPLLSLVSGNDNIPDIVIGRFSAGNKQDVKTMVEKVIYYENNIESGWFHKGMGIASDLLLNPYESDWHHMRDIRTTLLSGHYTEVQEFYDGSQGLMDSPGNPTPSDIVLSTNNGVSLINYTGHGDFNRWETSQFWNAYVDSLENVTKLPFIYSVACDVGYFDKPNAVCLAEKWMIARQQNTNKPTGSIGFYGSSIPQAQIEPMKAQKSFNEQLIEEDFLSIGSLCYSSACDMMNLYTTGQAHLNAVETFNTWILFGDPSLQIIPNNNVGRTIFLEGDIETDSTYTKDFVDVHNATIKNNTDIIIDSNNYTIFNGEFRVESGSTLLVR